LHPPATFDPGVVQVATLLHFLLSIIYAASLASIAAFLKVVPIIWVGFGLTLYLVNLYGFTELFPWFARTRGCITLIADGVFSVVVILVYQWLNVNSVRSESGVH